MAIATFNTQILSSNSDEFLQYNLDEVIDKDFSPQPSYGYYLINEKIPGVTISGSFNEILNIPPNIEFKLSITVSNSDKNNLIEATATTDVKLGSNPFEDALQSFLNNPNLQQNLSKTKSDWVNIINRNTNNDVIAAPF